MLAIKTRSTVLENESLLMMVASKNEQVEELQSMLEMKDEPEPDSITNDKLLLLQEG